MVNKLLKPRDKLLAPFIDERTRLRPLVVYMRARLFQPKAESNGGLISDADTSDRRSRKRRAYVIVRPLVYQRHLRPSDPEL